MEKVKLGGGIKLFPFIRKIKQPLIRHSAKLRSKALSTHEIRSKQAETFLLLAVQLAHLCKWGPPRPTSRRSRTRWRPARRAGTRRGTGTGRIPAEKARKSRNLAPMIVHLTWKLLLRARTRRWGSAISRAGHLTGTHRGGSPDQRPAIKEIKLNNFQNLCCMLTLAKLLA